MSRSTLGAALVVGFVIRIVLLIVNLEVFVLPQGGADALRFERQAWEHSARGRQDFAVGSYSDEEYDFIVVLGSAIYTATGRAPYVLGLLMVMLGVGVIYLSYRAALELWGDERIALVVAWSAALFPQLILHSVLFLREIPVSFCLAAAALCLVRYVRNDSAVAVVWFSVWILFGTLFHSGVIFAIPALLLGVLLSRPRGEIKRGRFYVVNAFAVLMLIVVIYAANATGFGLDEFGGSLEGALAEFEMKELRGTEGASAFPEWMRVRGGLSDAWKVPVRLVALVFAPLLPFMVRSAYHLLGLFDAALYLFLCWNIYRNWGTIKENRAVVMLLVVLVMLFLVYALGVSNFGTAIRHRAKMAPILLILAAGLPELRRLMYWNTTTASTPPPRNRPRGYIRPVG